MADRDRILQALETGPSQNISFSFTSSTGVVVTVNGTTFQRVASAIRDGRLTLVITNSFPDGVGAQYFQGSNTLRVRPPNSRFNLAQLLHEAVHASFDLTRSGGVNASNEEAAAYIAEYVYYRRTGLAPQRVISDSITQAARPIADSVVQRRPITSAQVTALGAAISGHSVYTNMPAGPYNNNG